MRKKMMIGRMLTAALVWALFAAGLFGCGKSPEKEPAREETVKQEDTGEDAGKTVGAGENQEKEERKEEMDPVEARKKELADDLLVDEDGNPLSPEDLAAMDGELDDGMPAPMEEFDSAQELAEATSLSIEEVTELPFVPVHTIYLVYDNGMYEIQYEEESGNQISFLKGEGTGDVSGLAGTGMYVGEETVMAGDRKITVYSEEDTVYFATWTDGTYAYSILVDAGCTAEEIVRMAESVQ